MEEYRTIRGTAAGEYEEKKSRFLAAAAHVESEAEAVAFLEQVRAANRTARHNVYAYKLREGSRERYSDDGEPAKTAGTPVLEVIGHSGLTDLIIVVTRYFGGILLGTGGLVRAYQGAAKEGLSSSLIITRIQGIKLKITTDYTGLGKIQYILGERGIPVLDSAYTEKVELTALAPEKIRSALEEELTDGTNGRAVIEEAGTCFYGEIDGKIQVLE